MKKFALPCVPLLLLCCSLANAQSSSNATVHLRDFCDPTTFNAVLGPGACARDTSGGFQTFTDFLGEIGMEKSAGAWRFVPLTVKANDGSDLTVQNLGGELHTFTEVKKFGGGFVDVLNQASGNPDPAPECAKMVDGQLVPQPPGPENLFVPAGGTATLAVDGDEGKVQRYQCCIHPWMRTTLRVQDREHEDHK